MDVEAEFILEDGLVSTAILNGLPGRWFDAAIRSGRAGDKTLMEHILTIARHSRLMLSEERSEDGRTSKFKYSSAECRILHSLDILVRIIGLHLLLHTYLPSFTTTEEEGAYQTDESTYRTRHVDGDCQCEFIELETESLIAVLSQGKVPKLVITDDLEFRVVSEDDYPYIALSHVWADGLRNPKTNALPRCQLRRLQSYVKQLIQIHDPASRSSSVPVAFWMDTLCIPVHPSELAKSYRKKAIQLLGKTFHEATAVLILDRELEIVESATTTFVELGLRILCSGWVKRLWTLQEASLASEARGADKVYFQMQDGPFLYQKYDRDRKALNSLDERTTELQAEERTLLCENGIMLELGAQIPSVRAMRQMRDGWSPFRVIHSAIEHRSTSKFEDVPVCIASLLGKDLTTIVSTSDAEQRMARFYMLMREVPMGVLWADSAEKLSKKPFRWAPKSITSCPATTTFAGWKDGICDENGLHLKAGGFMFAENELEQHEAGSSLPQLFNLISAETGSVFCHMRMSSRDRRSIPLEKNMAVIFKSRDQDVPPNAVIVSVEDAIKPLEDDQLEYACRVAGYANALLLRDAPEAGFKGYMTAEDQRWCIT
ncbi:hypothetical protein VNI00_015131 [Paramarasmius palmivorus]|uniref:Heterokaryon incompatibility domain-containing protein n=1 Tax=Paramarasmius palmivorus TaxID=297713 RepID=A0AAW0BNP0_9AGAR